MGNITGLLDPVVIASAFRTPLGSFQGAYSNFTAPQLGGVVIAEILNKTKINKNSISEVIMGCVLPAGLGQAPARQASLYGGLSNNVPCTTVNKMCGSGLKTIIQAYDNILADDQKIIIAGGMENMSQAPYLIPKARAGLRLGHGVIIDHMFLDGLEDAYEKGCLMGVFAERTAQKYNFTRGAQDEFAITSTKRAQDAADNKKFIYEIAEVNFIFKNKEILISQDETISKISQADIDKIPKLQPAFDKNGTVTAANSSSISDGASAVLIMRLSKSRELGLKPIAKIIDYSEFAHEPAWFTTAPVRAIENLLKKIDLTTKDISLFEINEAFAVVTMAAIQDLSLDPNKVNIHGGACALGHPIGASGARILTTLVHALKTNELGVASLCIGGGEALALAIERL